MAVSEELGHSKSGVSPELERFAVFLIASLGIFYLINSLFLGQSEPIPVTVTLSVTLGLVMYLWLARSNALTTIMGLHKELDDAQVAMIKTLVETIEAKDPYTHGHSMRVTRVAEELARRLGWDESAIKTVSRSAILHDIGKLGISDSILHKVGKLTDEEWKIIRDHPQKTSEILAPLKFLEKEVYIARFHHERCDGEGYSAGLCGKDIPLESSIIAVADAFDAMNSDRPYRKRMPREKIISELEKGKGIQHPALMVDTLIELLREKPDLWTSE